MTNGEKLCVDFPNMRYTISEHRVITTIGVAASFDLDWWNAEYKESTTKNDLGVDCISREATVKRLCNLAEYMNEHKENSGDPYIMAALFIQDNKTEFPSVTPQEPVLDKIRAEIKALSPEPTAYDVVDGNPIKDAVWETLIEVDKILDKYKAESEG